MSIEILSAENEQLKGALKTTMSKLMAHNQVVNELLHANLDLRAALHLSQNSHPLQSNVQGAVASENAANAPTAEAVPEELAPKDANPVPA